ncbi:MAG TPA: hypothetical protein VF665_16740 [Longimicrobium sp.]|jgi:hypothetical protein|uniref:hypothetical protein n=1 Tax=Longimicrobium sp. TaxID=2029185 RepID=UPI002ED7CF46
MNNAQPIPPIIPGPTPPGSQKKGCLKAAGIGCGVLLLLFFLLIVGGMVFFNRNKEGMQASAAEGAQFGTTTDEDGCIAEGKKRAANMNGITEGIKVGTFARGCLEYSRSTPGFCTGVPAPTSIRQTAEWRVKQCGNDATCPGVMTVKQSYCTDGAPKRIQTGGAPPAATGPQSPAPADSNSF